MSHTRNLIGIPPERGSIHPMVGPNKLDIVAAMPTLTDAELKLLMTQLARVQGLDLSEERVDRDLVAYKGHLAASERIRAVPLPLEAEPFVRLKH